MFKHVPENAVLKVYVDGGADFTGTYRPGSARSAAGLLGLVAPNGKVIIVREDAVVAFVEL